MSGEGQSSLDSTNDQPTMVGKRDLTTDSDDRPDPKRKPMPWDEPVSSGLQSQSSGDVDSAMEMISSRVVSGNKKYFQTLLGLLIFSLILSVLAVVTW